MAKTLKLLMFGAAFALLLFAAGFIFFTLNIHRTVPAINRTVDGIVALTGGRLRLSEAVKLLQRGQGRRLLISGVYKKTTKTALAKRHPASRSLFACCVDIGYEALDTFGNAMEARDWAHGHGFKSLIVVTSSYHMPRTLAELRTVMPMAEIIAHPVLPKNVRVDAWWVYPGTARLLFSEYLKFLPAAARLAVAEILGRSAVQPMAHADPARIPKI